MFKLVKTYFPDKDSAYSTCEHCGQSFKLESNEKIIPFLMFCSHLCRFRFVYKRLSLMTEDNLLSVAKAMFPDEKDIVYSQNLIFKVSKYCLKFNLYPINLSAHGSAQDLLAQVNELPVGSKVGSTHTIYSVEPMSRELSHGLDRFINLSRQTKKREVKVT